VQGRKKKVVHQGENKFRNKLGDAENAIFPMTQNRPEAFCPDINFTLIPSRSGRFHLVLTCAFPTFGERNSFITCLENVHYLLLILLDKNFNVPATISKCNKTSTHYLKERIRRFGLRPFVREWQRDLCSKRGILFYR
jgi:hypothetical protein